jgi:hypothetical protein
MNAQEIASSDLKRLVIAVNPSKTGGKKLQSGISEVQLASCPLQRSHERLTGNSWSHQGRHPFAFGNLQKTRA